MENNQDIFVYGLFDPTTDELRYIGKTTCGMKRVKVHCHESAVKKTGTHKRNWVNSLWKQGLKPHHAILAHCADEAAANSKEIELISYYREQGFNLTNGTTGGEGSTGASHSNEAKAKISKSRIGRKHSDETKAKISKAMAGRRICLGAAHD